MLFINRLGMVGSLISVSSGFIPCEISSVLGYSSLLVTGFQ
jgi:hypothetical protein